MQAAACSWNGPLRPFSPWPILPRFLGSVKGEAVAASELSYTLLDRAGVESSVDFDAVRGLIRQGRMFRGDRLRLADGREVSAGELPELKAVFAEVAPGGEATLPNAPTIAGEGDTLALLEVFARLFHQKQTGRLFVQHPELGHERVVVFREGVPIAAWSNVEDEWIGEVLVHKGFIDQTAFDEAVHLRQETGVRLGSALVKLDKISPRRLQMALSVQALDRLLNLFRGGEGTRFRFVPDESAAQEEVLLVARPREVIETAIATALSPAEVKALLDGYGYEAIRVDVAGPLAEELTSGDGAVLEVLAAPINLIDALPRVAQVARLTLPEARVRVLALATFGVIQLGNDRTRRLQESLEALQAQNYFDRLQVRLGATPTDVREALVARRKALKLDQEGDLDGSATVRLRAQIGALLEVAAATLVHPLQRAFYQRAIQIGVDFEDLDARKLVEFDEFMSRGHIEMEKKAYPEAREAFQEASKRIPKDPRPYVMIGWSRFLAGNSDKRAAAVAVKDVQRAIEEQPDFDVAWLYLGKIHRLAGELQPAEQALRKAIQVNPRNMEAQSELRLIFTRELGTPGQSRIRIDPRLSSVLGVVVVVVGLLFFLANRIHGGATLWPDVGALASQTPDAQMKEVGALVQLRLQNDEPTLVSAARELGAAPQVDTKEEALTFLSRIDIAKVREVVARVRTVPHEQQVLGNVEYYYLADDTFWWVRRLILLVVGLLGIVLLGGRLKLAEGAGWLGQRHAWLLAALPYGAVLGFLSATIPPVTELGTLLGMSCLHVLAEQLFFFGFVGRALLAQLDNKVAAVGLTAVAYGLYQLSFFAVLNQPLANTFLDVTQIGVFVGGGCALLMWRSGGLLAPFMAQFVLNLIMILRSAS